MIGAIALGVSTVVATLLVLLVRAWFFGYPPPSIPVPRSSLSAKEQAIVAACADALFPPGGPIPVSGTQAGIVRYMERYIRGLSATAGVLVHLLLHFVEHSSWIFGPRRVRFTRLRPQERVVVLRSMSQSSVYFRRVSFLSLRVMLTMGYLANDDVARAIGLTPEAAPFEREARAERPLASGGDRVFA